MSIIRLCMCVLALSTTLSLALAQPAAQPTVPAQGTMSGEDIIAAMEAEVETISDLEARLQGNITNLEGFDFALDIFVQLITDAKVARAEFFAPLELADNFILLYEDVVYNYLFLTNQVTILDADDPDALGSLLPDLGDNETAGYDLSLERLFVGWTAEVLDYFVGEVDGNLQPVYRVRLDSPGAEELYIIFEVAEDGWQPSRLQIFQKADDVQLLEFSFRDFARDTGLTVSTVTYIPDDAEVIDER